jgi:hypothetical protein
MGGYGLLSEFIGCLEVRKPSGCRLAAQWSVGPTRLQLATHETRVMGVRIVDAALCDSFLE